MSELTPHVIWLFGLSGAGKSTLAERLSAKLRADGVPVLGLDGDALRAGLCAGLGFSDADRSENLRRAAEAARLGLQSRLGVVAAFITPRESQRDLIRSVLGRGNVSLVYLSASLDVCRARDVKGLYAKASTGRVSQMTGISSAFEEPRSADLVLETSGSTVEQSAEQLFAFAESKFRPREQS